MKIKVNDYKANEVLKIMREWTELTQKEYAKKVNKNYNSIQNYEEGRNRMYLNDFIEIANKLNMQITIEKFDTINKK